MPEELGISHGVMEGSGAYNKHAKIPAGGAALSAPFLLKAAQNTTLGREDQPVFATDRSD